LRKIVDSDLLLEAGDPLGHHDVEKANPDLIAPQLCGQYLGQNGRKSACLAAFKVSRPCILATDPVSLHFFRSYPLIP
jgi:hypothetical protein